MERSTLIFVAVVVVFVVMTLMRRAGTTPSSDVHKLVEDGATLLDVRSPEEFASGHIDGALNIPVDSLEGRVGELGEPNTPVVVYCASGVRSNRAKKLLVAKGFASVHDLGGMGNW